MYCSYDLCPPGSSIDYRDCTSPQLTIFHLYLIHTDSCSSIWHTVCICGQFEPTETRHLCVVRASPCKFKGLLYGFGFIVRSERLWFRVKVWHLVAVIWQGIGNELHWCPNKDGKTFVYVLKCVSHLLCPRCQPVSPGLADSSEGQTSRRMNTDGHSIFASLQEIFILLWKPTDFTHSENSLFFQKYI